MSFAEKVVIVTGAAKGIGRQVAYAYGEEAAYVALVDKDGEGIETLASEMKRKGQVAYPIQADLGDPDQISLVVEKTVERFGRINILINNAGIGIWKSPYELTVQEWDEVLNVNLRAPFLMAREAAKRMRGGGGGAIVNIASTRAFMSEPNTESYSASKGGIVALTHALAISFAPDRIRVNAISPGWIETGNYQSLREMDHRQHPAGRVGKPTDIAKACLFLTDEENDFITGQNFIIDGGMTKKMIYEP
ncbi:Uncharacterized oxidoreductase TM_0019 [[Clostridium] ultunense Esp]|uniref:glucose 1-dehydrogenase n=1 Tax=Thermicanus aegyptius TaxID=94009 RepID=UPI0002B6EEDA|nr:glucose 1-dehydrogenase [Thermicanus aegyptius]CCQ97661.1 Uncharacterized oxidoreductase TM_0019 [[Clostridium] ultunense Esp]